MAAVGDIGFEAIIVRGIVARSKTHSTSRAKMTNCERNFRSGTWPFEEIGIATKIGSHLGAGLGEISGEMTGVVSDHKGSPPFTLVGIANVAHITNHRAFQIEKIHGGGSDTRMLGAIERTTFALFGPGNDASDRATAQPTGPKSQSFEEAVVNFLPFSGGYEFGNRGLPKR